MYTQIELSIPGMIVAVLIICAISLFPAQFNAFIYYGGLTLAAIIGLAILYYATRALIFVGQILFLLFFQLPLSMYRKMTA